MNTFDNLNEIMKEHENIVKKLQEMEKFCTKEARDGRYYTINLLEQEFNVIKKCFDSVSKYYQFNIRESVVVNSLMDNILLVVKAFISTKLKGD